ncbi:hypothetical protein CPB86DRAFT_795438 [Serendipita vermifera]|nr:hypothetical protein CPB86DRAFT_795438 [Serendipita vermifera]
MLWVHIVINKASTDVPMTSYLQWYFDFNGIVWNYSELLPFRESFRGKVVSSDSTSVHRLGVFLIETVSNGILAGYPILISTRELNGLQEQVNFILRTLCWSEQQKTDRGSSHLVVKRRHWHAIGLTSPLGSCITPEIAYPPDPPLLFERSTEDISGVMNITFTIGNLTSRRLRVINFLHSEFVVLV